MNESIIITSFDRPSYLAKTLESLRKTPGLDIYVVDGGSEDQGEIERICSEYANDWDMLPHNPGADVLKNHGIKNWMLNGCFDAGQKVTPRAPHFLCSSDDFLYPDGWLVEALSQWGRINVSGRPHGIKYAMMACPTELVIQRHTFEQGDGPTGRGCGYHYRPAKGCPEVEIMTTSVSMVAGTILDTAAVIAAGGFPVYGRTGQGDIAISREFRAKQYEVGYFKSPVLVHLGQNKDEEYPDYSKAFELDDDVWQARARAHRVGQRRGFDWPVELPGTAL